MKNYKNYGIYVLSILLIFASLFLSLPLKDPIIVGAAAIIFAISYFLNLGKRKKKGAFIFYFVIICMVCSLFNSWIFVFILKNSSTWTIKSKAFYKDLTHALCNFFPFLMSIKIIENVCDKYAAQKKYENKRLIMYSVYAFFSASVIFIINKTGLFINHSSPTKALNMLFIGNLTVKILSFVIYWGIFLMSILTYKVLKEIN